MEDNRLMLLYKFKKGLSKATLFVILSGFTILSAGCNSKGEINTGDKTYESNIVNPTVIEDTDINSDNGESAQTESDTTDAVMADEKILESDDSNKEGTDLEDTNKEETGLEGTNNEETDNEEKEEKIELSMEEAIAIGKEKAAEYYDNMVLSEVHSYDMDKYSSIDTGYDGKRQWWYVTYANEKDNYVNVLIKDGEIIDVSAYDNHGNFGLIDASKIKITSKEAANIARDLGLRGGDPQHPEEWVSGFNFALSISSLISEPDVERIFMEVIGISPNGNFAHVDIDAETGEVLLAEEKFEYEDGTAEWKSFIMK